MGRRPHWLVGPLLAAAFIAGCAGARRDGDADVEAGEREPAVELELGLAALDRADFDLAREHFVRAYTHCWAEPPGRRALLLLASLELDPRNPERRPDAAARLAADYLHLAGSPAWTASLAEVIYLAALDDGAEAPAAGAAPTDAAADSAAAPTDSAAAEADVASAAPRPLAPTAEFPDDCDPDEPPYIVTRPLPALPGPSTAARLGALQQQRDTLTSRVAALEARLDAVQKQLAAREEELARIRKTLRP